MIGGMGVKWEIAHSCFVWFFGVCVCHHSMVLGDTDTLICVALGLVSGWVGHLGSQSNCTRLKYIITNVRP